MQRPQSAYRNQLLRALAPNDFVALAPHLKATSLASGLNLGRVNCPIDRVCFPESGIVSVVTASLGLGSVEIGMIGYEGMTGLAVVMGDDRSSEEANVQVAGTGHTITGKALAGLLDQRPTLRRTMLRFAYVFAVQVAQTALANGRAKMDVRLARQLLMTADRIDIPDLPLTHEMLATAMGVRRPGITDALHRLEGELLIRNRRSHISIRDRAALEAVAHGAYGVPEREYQRVFGNGASTDTGLRRIAPETILPQFG